MAPADGSRVNAIIPPLALDGPTISIRKFTGNHLSAQQLIENGSMTDACTSVRFSYPLVVSACASQPAAELAKYQLLLFVAYLPPLVPLCYGAVRHAMAGALFEQAAHKFVRRSYDSYAACMYLLGCEYLNGNGIDVSDQGGRDAADAQAHADTDSCGVRLRSWEVRGKWWLHRLPQRQKPA